MPSVSGYDGPSRALALSACLPHSRIAGTVSTPQQAGVYVNRAAGSSPNMSAIIMPKSGSLCGLSNRLYAAAATGTNTVQVYINGAAIAGASVAMSGAVQAGNILFAANLYAFAAGDCLDLRVTSSAWVQAGGGVYYKLWVVI